MRESTADKIRSVLASVILVIVIMITVAVTVAGLKLIIMSTM